MLFKVLGPYSLRQVRMPIVGSEFKKAISGALDPDVYDACGCYIYGVSSSGGAAIKPWYVGKARYSSIGRECSTVDKANKLNLALREYERYHLKLFVIARITPQGRYAKPTRGNGMLEIEKLEEMLMSIAVRVNPDLINVRSMKVYREMVVPGVMNTGQGQSSKASRFLASMFGLE